MRLKMDKIFVTGGSGFIGSHLVCELIKMGYDVTNYDLQISSTNLQANNIQGDIMDYEKLVFSMRGHKIVCHLAAMVGVVKCLNDEKEVYRIDYEGVRNLVKSCKETGVENILFASSSEVYGEGDSEKALCESRILEPKSPYGIAKMLAEKLLKEYAEENNVKVTVVRYCNVYGPIQRKEFVIPIFINKVLYGEPIPVCELGEQVRNFTYVGDAVEGTIKALFRSEKDYEVFNISSGDTFRIIDVANKILELNNNIGQIKFVSFEEVNRVKKYEVITRIPSTKKAMDKLQFKARTSFDDGLRVTYNYYKENLLKE